MPLETECNQFGGRYSLLHGTWTQIHIPVMGPTIELARKTASFAG